MKVLVVDDDDNLLEVYRINLELDGHQVVSETGGIRAFELALQVQPDLIISDIRMPEGDGIYLLKKIQTSSAVSAPVIITTGYFRDLGTQDILDLGAIQVLTKPVDFSIVENLIRELIDDA